MLEGQHMCKLHMQIAAPCAATQRVAWLIAEAVSKSGIQYGMRGMFIQLSIYLLELMFEHA